MTRARGAASLAAAVLLVAATSCASNGNEPAANGSPSPNPSATTTSSSSAQPTATQTSQTEVASEAATDLLRRYYAVRNDLRQHPKQPLSLLKTVAISTELTAQQNLFKKERKQGLHQTGETKVPELEVQSVNLEHSDPKAGKVPTVQIDACFDVSGVDIVDPHGKSIVSPHRPNTGWIRYLVSNYRWNTDPRGGWRVASSQDIERTPCAAP